jgi:hypothetical protein
MKVRSEPARPQVTLIGHRPGGVRTPIFHVHETRPLLGRFRWSAVACERRPLYVTRIEQMRAGETATLSVAYDPALTGEVMWTRRTRAEEAVASTRKATRTIPTAARFTLHRA